MYVIIKNVNKKFKPPTERKTMFYNISFIYQRHFNDHVFSHIHKSYVIYTELFLTVNYNLQSFSGNKEGLCPCNHWGWWNIQATEISSWINKWIIVKNGVLFHLVIGVTTMLLISRIYTTFSIQTKLIWL